MAFACVAQAQQTHYWVGGSGAWSDAAHWSLSPGGTGGAGVPSAKDPVQAGPFTGDVSIALNGNQAAASLAVDGSGSQVSLRGNSGRLALKGDLVLRGNVDWDYTGALEVSADKHSVVQLDTRGIPLGSDLYLLGGGAFNMANDLVLREGRGLELREGTLVLNGAMLKADAVEFPGNKTKKLMAGTSVVLLAQTPDAGEVRDAVDAGTSQLLVGGVPTAWGPDHGPVVDDARGVSTCGVGAGQTLFTINAALLSNYNGFGVSCHSVCDGIVKVTVTGGVGPNFLYSWIGGPGTAQWNNVCPGNQIVIVTDLGQGVSCATTVQVTDPARLSVIFTGNVPPTCSDVCDGTSIALAVGGVPNYSYNWNNGNGTSQVYNQLCAGINTLHVTDVNNCAFDTIFNFPIQPIVPNLTKTNVLCHGDCNGTAQVNPTGGHIPYTYNWQPGNPPGDGTNAVTGLCAGNYAVTITDLNGCDTTVTFTITQPQPIVPHATHVNATCAGVCDGSATVAPTGGSGNYGYSWAPPPGGGGTSATATGLCAGTYTVTITDNANGCDTAVAIIITAPPPIAVVPTVTEPNCHGDCNGSIVLATTGGTGGFTYVWTPASAGTGASISNLCAGPYSVTVSSGVCDTVINFNLTEPDLIAPSTAQTDVSCAGACDGTAGGPATGGTAPYTYTWAPVPPVGQGTETASQLCAGTWGVTITDAHGCDTTVQYLITEPLPLAIAASQTNETCGNLCNGTATVVVSGGTPDYTYLWSPAPPVGQGTASASQLCAGTWTVTVTDDHGCELVQSFTILPAVPINVTLATTPVSCAGICDGTATGTVSGGIPPYTFLWSPAPGTGQGTLNATGLCAGPGTFTVTDAAGCDTTITFTIDAPLPILVTSTPTDPSCFGVCDGSIALVATGGTGTYTYTWTPASAGTGASVSNLCAGPYQVVVSSGICDTTISFILNAPPPFDLTLNTTPSNCANTCTGTASLTGNLAGLVFAWSPQPGAGQGTANATALCPDNYTVTVSNAAGCDTVITFSIDAPPPLVPDLQVTDASCGTACDGLVVCPTSGGVGPYTYFWSPPPGSGQGTSTAGGLCPGNYMVTITDSNGCDTTLQFTISRPAGIMATAVITPSTCSNTCDGTITVTATGGVLPYTWNWVPEPGTGQGTSSAGGLCPGTYNVTISDQASCDTTIAFVVGSPAPIDPHATVNNETCAGPCDGSVTVTPTGGSGSYSFAWIPSSLGSGNFVGNLCAGDYTSIITDSNGCDTTWNFTILPVPPFNASVSAVTAVSCANSCDGTATADIPGGIAGLTLTWAPAPVTGQGTLTATDLCPGPHTLTIADAAGCDTVINFTIDAPTPLAPVLNVTDASCGTACDGAADITTTGGTPGYTYVWTPAPGSGQGTSSVGGLCPDNYTVTITDAAGCDTTLQFTIARPASIMATATITPASCANICDGTINVTAIGGVEPYTWNWVPDPGTGQGTSSVGGLCPGTYNVTISDQAGCDTTFAFVVGSPAPIDPHGTFTNETCAGPCDGTASVAPTGGSGIFTYAWVPASLGTAASVSGLCAGDYSVTVSDNAGCDSTWSFTILPVPPFNASLSAVTAASCANSCDGTATADIPGGIAGLTLTWAPTPVTGQGTLTATDLCPGPHTLTIADAAGCDTVINFTIDAPTPLAPVLNVINASCGTACDGAATITMAGGTPGYTYVWTPEPGTGQGTASVGALCPDNYIVTVTDTAGCDTTLQFTISRPGGIMATGVVSPASCSNICDGTITVTASGGVPPYTWNWVPEPGLGQGTPSVSQLCPGTYNVTIGDQAGCDTTIAFVVGSPAPIDPHGTFTNESCAGPCDGSATVAPTGGSGSFSFSWTPAGLGNGNFVGGLCAGDYSSTITDSNGCDSTWSFTVEPTSPIQAAVATIDGFCHNDCNGEATVTATGGAGGFSYAWTPEPQAGQGTDHATGFCAGPGFVVVTDAGGCDTTVFFEIFKNQPIQPNLTVYPENCTGPCTGEAGVSPVGGVGPFMYDWQPAPLVSGQGTSAVIGLCAGTAYTVTIVDALGCDTTIAFTVAPFDPIVPVVTVNAATCSDVCDGSASVSATGGSGPYVYIWDPVPPNGQGDTVATGLCAGTYLLTVADANGCDTTVSFTITAPLPIDPIATVTPIACGGQCNGAIDLNTQGGSGSFTYTWTPPAPIGDGTANVSGLCAGDWTVMIADIAGCDTSITFTLDEPLPVAATMDVLPSHCGVCDGSVQLHPTGGTAPYSFTFGPPLNLSTTDSLLTGLCAGVYSVTVTDAAGCSVQLAIAITDADGEVLTMNNGQTSCPGVCDGEVSVAYNCSVAPCTVAWSDLIGNPLGQPSDTLSNLCVGGYLVAVTNGNGCISIDTAFVTEPAPLVGNISSSPVSCIGACDGTATIGITGGTGPFTFTWSPAPGGTGQGAPHATGLCAGSYVIHVDDLGGCDADFNVLITAPTAVTVSPDVSEVTCAGLCDGAINLNAQGGTGTLTYVWSPAPPIGQGTGSVSGLCPGSYSVLLFDGHNCDTTITFTLADPAPVVLSGTATLSHCAVCDGTAEVTATGGTGALGIEWTSGGTIVGTDSSLTGLCAGVYTATATDAQGCMAMQTVVVPDATAEQLTVTNGQTLCANTCDGEVSVSYNCSVPPCITTWLDASGGQLAQGQDTLSDLCAGMYFVVVGNGDGCTAIDTALVTPSQTITPNLSTMPVTCNGACDGIATVGPMGGIAPYTFLWDNGDTTAQVTGLCAGTYGVTISDASGCDTFVNVLITAPQPITVAVQSEDVSCNGSCDGSIVVSPSGGSGSFTYVWSPSPPSGLGSNGAFDLCPGTWMVTIADTHGCDTTLSIIIAEPAPIMITASATMSDCGVCNGTAEIEISGGTAPYASAWLLGGAIVGTDTAITGLCAGLYSAVVQDANGCLAHKPVAIGDIGGEVLQTPSTLLTCPTDCNGQLVVNYNCGTPACTVAWYNGMGTDLNQSGDTINNLCFGTYFVQVTNGAGCISIDTAHVIPPPTIQANLTTTPELCAGSCNGTALVAPTGGTGSTYTYLWDPTVVGQGGPQAVFMCAGPYTVTITDSVGCFINQGVNILSPQPLTGTFTVVQNNCKGADDGSITVVGQGGTGLISYTWSPEPGGGQGTGTATGLTEGTWNVTLGDVNGCDTTISITLVDPPGMNVIVTHTDNGCFNDCVATAHAEISGGTAPYITVWTDTSGTVIDVNTLDVFGLCGGDYVFTVTDSSGCSIASAFSVATGVPIDAGLVVQGETCNGPCDGTATVSPTGGSGSGYGYLWVPDVNGQGTETATDLCPGNYTVTITDGLGCDSVFAFTVDPFTPLLPNANLQDVSCNGSCDGVISLNVSGGTGTITYVWSPEPPVGQGTAEASGLCPQVWEVTIADGAGCDTTLSFTISEPEPLVVAVDEVLPSSCPTATDGSISITASGGTTDYGYAWTGPGGFTSNLEDLPAVMSGTYDLTVTDQHGCTATLQVTVGALSSVVAVAGVDQTVCAGGTLTLDGSASQGATDHVWNELGGNVVGNTAIVQLTGISVGPHSYVLTVSDGVCTATDTVQVQILASPSVDAGPDQEVFLQGTVTLGGAPSGPPGSSFVWQPDSLLDHFDSANPLATVDATTLFIITVTSPEGCIGTDSVLITVVPEIKVPSGFTPNGDGHNDTWILDFAPLFPGIEVQIFSRWGEPLFRSVGYATPWDGKVDGTVVPVGTYYYAIELNDPRFPDALTGPLTVIR
jgi:gliding motility-associated-like protein